MLMRARSCYIANGGGCLKVLICSQSRRDSVGNRCSWAWGIGDLPHFISSYHRRNLSASFLVSIADTSGISMHIPDACVLLILLAIPTTLATPTTRAHPTIVTHDMRYVLYLYGNDNLAFTTPPPPAR